jgi:hypothetical protein
MNVPPEDDWRSEEWGLDAESAYRKFHGKTMEEAVRLFEDNSLARQEDVLFMPSRVFAYYLRAYMTYLLSDAAKGDSDGASCFISLIGFKAEHKRDDIVPLWPEIEPVLTMLAARQDDFDADWDVYGSFRTRCHEIVQRGFKFSFDTETPETLPDTMTLGSLGFSLFPKSVTLPVAVQIFRHSGIGPIDATAQKTDILGVFGPPDAAGGGEHSPYGYISEWVRYERPECDIRFQFDGDRVTNVLFAPSGSLKRPTTFEPFVVDERVHDRNQDRDDQDPESED